jgi:hypothetical protein
MQERAIVYFVVAYLACWLVDLLIQITSRPLMLDPMLKAIIVLGCLVVVLIGLSRNRWLLSR